MDMQPGNVRNVRATNQSFSIATSGFEYARLEDPPNIDWMDPEQVKNLYFPQLEKLVKDRLVVRQRTVTRGPVCVASNHLPGGNSFFVWKRMNRLLTDRYLCFQAGCV